MPQDDVMRCIALETLLAATESLDGAAAEALAERVGRRVSAALGDAGGAAAQRLLADGSGPLPPAVANALARGLSAGRADAPSAAYEAPASPWGAPPRTLGDLARTARRAAHDLNQPLTVILGYAAILRRTGNEALRVEAAGHIVQEARKMNDIIAGLLRIARSLDVA